MLTSQLTRFRLDIYDLGTMVTNTLDWLYRGGTLDIRTTSPTIERLTAREVAYKENSRGKIQGPALRLARIVWREFRSWKSGASGTMLRRKGTEPYSLSLVAYDWESVSQQSFA